MCPPHAETPSRSCSPSLRRRGRALAVLLALALLPADARRAGADWVDDFYAKVDGWEQQLDDALKRVEAAADAAKQKLDQAMQARLDELRQVLEDERDALKAAASEQKKEWAAVIEKRLAQVTREARDLADDLEGVVRGSNRAIRGEASRLSTGVRTAVLAGLHEAKAIVGEATLVDGSLVAQVKVYVLSDLVRWGFILLVVLGAMVVAVGCPLSFRASKPLAVVFLLAGLGCAGFGAYRLYAARRGAVVQVPLGLAECPALAEAQGYLARDPHPVVPAVRAQAEPIRRRLARCQALAADDTLAQVSASQLRRLHTALGGN
jgi:hypothetical protein